MMSHGSQQLRQFRRAIRSGATLDEACAATGGIINPIEGKYYLDRDAKFPPPPEAFDLLYDPDAPAVASNLKEMTMARSAKQNDDDEVTELKPMDFKQAVKIYHTDIAPERTEASSHMQSVGEGFKAIKKTCHIQPGAAKAAIKAFEQEDAFRDDYLRGFVGMLNEMLGFELVTFHGGDLVDQAEGKATRPKPQLATLAGKPLNHSDGSEEDLADAGEGFVDEADDFEESDEAELAAQAPRTGRKASVDTMAAAPAPEAVN